MRTRSTLLLALVTAIALLAIATSVAAANRLDFTNRERGFRVVWTPLSFEVAAWTIRCNFTLEGSLATRTFAKRIGTHIGVVTSAPISTCSGGTFSTRGLPWSLQYGGFAGTLPTIRSITENLINARFIFQPSGLPSCEWNTEAREPSRAIETVSAGAITQARSDETATIGTSGGFLCEFGSRGRFIGTGTTTVLGGTEETSVGLI